MAQGVDERAGSGQLAVISAVLADLVDSVPVLLSGAEQLALLKVGFHLEAQLHTWLVLARSGGGDHCRVG